MVFLGLRLPGACISSTIFGAAKLPKELLFKIINGNFPLEGKIPRVGGGGDLKQGGGGGCY